MTVNLPAAYIDAIQYMVERGIYPNRSEAIRVALRAFLAKELQLAESLIDIFDTPSKKKVATVPNKVKKIDMRTIRTGWK